MYELVTQWVTSTPWAILPEKLAVICDVLALRAAGGQVSEAEIAAATNGRRNDGPQQAGMVAVLPLYGVIAHRADMLMESSGGTSTERFTQAFRRLLADDQVSAIVLDVDSPGGAVDGVPELAAEIVAARGRKPVVAVANTLAASAAYWIGSAADELLIAPSGEVGSIGVLAVHQDLSARYEQEGIKTTLLYAGKYKTEGNPWEPLSEDARGYIQARIEDFYSMFVAAVAQQRGTSREAVKNDFGEGRVVGAKQAVAAGMADGIGTLDDAVRRAALLGRKAARERTRAADVAARAILAGV